MTTASELDERYGRTTRSRKPWLITAIIAGVALLIGAVWLGIRAMDTSVNSDDLGYHVVDEHRVDVTFQATSPRNKPLYCTVKALDEEFGIVGWKTFEYPASPEHARAFSVSVPTVALATTGLVENCWVE